MDDEAMILLHHIRHGYRVAHVQLRALHLRATLLYELGVLMAGGAQEILAALDTISGKLDGDDASAKALQTLIKSRASEAEMGQINAKLAEIAGKEATLSADLAAPADEPPAPVDEPPVV